MGMVTVISIYQCCRWSDGVARSGEPAELLDPIRFDQNVIPGMLRAETTPGGHYSRAHAPTPPPLPAPESNI